MRDSSSSQSQNYFKFINDNMYYLGTCNSNIVKIFVVSVLFATGIGAWHLILGPYDFVPGSFLWTKNFREHLSGYWWSNVLNWIFLNVIAGVYYFVAIETMQQYMMQGYNPIAREVPPPKADVVSNITFPTMSKSSEPQPVSDPSESPVPAPAPKQFNTNDSSVNLFPSADSDAAPTSSVPASKQESAQEQPTSFGSPLRQHLPTGVTPVELSPEEEQEIAAQRELHRAKFAEQERIDAEYRKVADQYILQLREQLTPFGIITGFICGFTAVTVALGRVMGSLVWFFLISFLVESIYVSQKPWSGFFFITQQPVFDGTAEFLTHYNNALFNGSFWMVMFLFVCHTFAFANLYVWKTLEQLISKIGIISILVTLVMLVAMRVLGVQFFQAIYETQVSLELEEPEVLNYTFNWALNWLDMVVVATCMGPFFIMKVFNPAVQMDEVKTAATAEEINQDN